MNIMYVTTEDVSKNTSSNIRNISLIKGLLENGNKVILVSRRTSENKSFDSIINNCEVVNLSKGVVRKINQDLYRKSDGLYKKILKKFYLFYIKYLSLYGPYLHVVKKSNIKTHHSEIDIIISSSDPKTSHLLALKIIRSNKLKVKWIQYWGDPLHNDMTGTFLFPNLQINKENKILSKANLILYTNPLAQTYMSQIFSDLKSKISWIPTAYFETQYREKKHSVLESSPIIGYFGDYFLKWRNIEPLYLGCLNKYYSLIIYGSGDYLFSKGEVEVYERASIEVMNKAQDRVDILVVITNNNKMNKDNEISKTIQVPGKLYHYAQSYKPVIIITEDKELERFYQGYNRFIFARNNVDDIKKAVEEVLINKQESYCSPVIEFTCKKVAQRLISEITNLQIYEQKGKDNHD